MLARREKVIVWDAAIEDMYAAVTAQDEADELQVNPLVEIRAVIHYPIQRAAMFPERASECAPLPEGTVCRLKLICKGWLCFDGTYEKTLCEARNLMIDEVMTRMSRCNGIRYEAARAEFDLLMKHRRGEYAPRTVMGRDAPFVARWPGAGLHARQS